MLNFFFFKLRIRLTDNLLFLKAQYNCNIFKQFKIT